MARTFDASDPGQFSEYLAESIAQMALYGNLSIGFSVSSKGTTRITIYDEGAMPSPHQDGFALAMDDGRVLPVPAPGGGL